MPKLFATTRLMRLLCDFFAYVVQFIGSWILKNAFGKKNRFQSRRQGLWLGLDGGGGGGEGRDEMSRRQSKVAEVWLTTTPECKNARGLSSLPLTEATN